MFLYLLKNSTLVDINLSESERNSKILIYGIICYIIIHATLFLGGKDALLYSLKPYFWIFLILDLCINYINVENNDIINNNPSIKQGIEQINNVFDKFLKKKEIEKNKKISPNLSNYNNNSNRHYNNSVANNSATNNLKKKKVRFQQPIVNSQDGYSSSSDSDLGTDIDMDSFRASLDNF